MIYETKTLRNRCRHGLVEYLRFRVDIIPTHCSLRQSFGNFLLFLPGRCDYGVGNIDGEETMKEDEQTVAEIISAFRDLQKALNAIGEAIAFACKIDDTAYRKLKRKMAYERRYQRRGQKRN